MAVADAEAADAPPPDPSDTRRARILRVVAQGARPHPPALSIGAALARADDRPLLHLAAAARRTSTPAAGGRSSRKPSIATWDNYSQLFDNDATSRTRSWTTVEIAIGGTLLPIIVAALAGYAFAWLDFPGRDWLFIGVIALLVVPLQMALIPIFTLYNTRRHLRHGARPRSSSTPRSGCRSRSSCCATSSSGSRRTSSSRRASTAPPSCGSSCG